MQFATPILDVFLHDLSILTRASKKFGKHFAIVVLFIILIRVGSTVSGAAIDRAS